MRKSFLRAVKLLLTAIFCFSASPAHAAIAWDNVGGHYACGGQTSASTTYTLTVAFTSGNTGIVVVQLPNNTTTVRSVTDNATSAYGSNPNVRKVNGTTSAVEIWYTGPGGVRGSVTTVTVTTSASGRFSVCGSNYSGVLGIGPPGAGATGSSTSASAGQTTIDNNNFIVAGMGRAAGTCTWTQGAAGNLRTNYGGASSTPSGAIMDNTAASAGSVTNTATLGTTGVWAVATVELRTITNKGFAGVR